MKISAILCIAVWMVCVSNVNCRCPKGTETDDPEGRCCVFPFVYGPKGIGAERTYYDCTVFKHDRFWCSLDAHYKGRWANCVCQEYEKTYADCRNGGTCIAAIPYRCECPPGWTGDKCEHRD